MRTLALAVLCAAAAAACDSDAELPEKPEVCKGLYIFDEPPHPDEECYWTTACYFDPDTGEWVVWSCDPPSVFGCDRCGLNELCVEHYDGTCDTTGPRCVPRTVDCPDNACSTECEAAYCPSPYQCQVRTPCGPESRSAFTCYGP